MANKSGFRIRLRVRISKAFTTEATSLDVKVGKKVIIIKSQTKDEPLNKAKWIVLNARGFLTEDEARQFGTSLRANVQLAALSSRLGVNVGEDKPTSWIAEDFARSMGLIKENESIAPNVHGLFVFPDNDNTRFPIINAEATVTADPEQFTSALSELGESDKIDFGWTANGVLLLNLALMNPDPLAQMVIAFSAVEELGQTEKWSETQVDLIKQLAVVAEQSPVGTAEERSEIVQSIRKGLFRLSLRQGVMRLLSHLGLEKLRREWDRLYGIRSGYFHGNARLSENELSQAALETVTLCGHIILALVAKEIGAIPSIAATHFNIATSPAV